MVGQLKEDVAEWYQGLSAHRRIEAMCTLIDLSMPFEIRFLGSLIEHLGRKDFGSLRDAESRANSFANGNPEDKKRLLQSLGEVAPLGLVNGVQYGNPLMHPNSFNDSPANRPSPTHVSDTKGRQPPPDSFHGSDNQNDHGGCGESSLNNHDTSGPKGNAKGNSANHIGFSSEEETESMCIINDLKRRKLILYISVLSPTNHDGANLYYTILSDIDDNPALTWLEDLDKDAQEEVSLLYTLATRHPAFTFEQRMFLGAVANRVNDIVGSKFPLRANSNLQQQPHHPHNSNPGTHPVYYNHPAIPHAMDPKYGGGYYIFAHPPMHIQQPPHQPSSVPSNGEQVRNPHVAAPFQYTSFAPYFVPHHPAPISHPTPLNSPYAQNIITSSMPIASSASIAAGSGQCLPQGTPVTPSSNSNTVVQGNNSSHQLSSPSSKPQHSQTQLPNNSSTASNSLSQQSCVSTPSRTSSVPFHSEQNSVDGDSAEESSENCDWNSPESSPFESPPQSLTPSRSQSPPSGVPSSTSVQTVSLPGHGSTFLKTSTGNVIPYGGSVNNVSSNSSSSSSTIVKTEFHPSSGLVISTATSCSSTSSLTSASNIGGNGNGPITNSSSSSSNNSGNNINPNKTSNITTPIHHTQLPLQCHLPPPQTTPSVRGPTKNNSSVPNNSNNQSFSSHPPNAVVVSSSSVISVPQQPQALPQSMMGPTVPVHMQQTSTLASGNSVGGIVSHSMSSVNPPLSVAFAQQPHGAHNNIGMNPGSHPPPSQNSFPCYPHNMNPVAFGAMNAAAAYRASPQGVLTRNQFIQQPHPAVAAASVLLNNQMGMKGPDLQRGGHNVHGALRQKPQPQNTPKRRTNVNSGGHVNMGSAPHANNSSTSGKGDEVCDLGKDNRNNEIVVSANPSNNKGSLQQQERTSGGGKPYHHNVSNGLVNPHPSCNAGAVLPGNPLSNIIPSNNPTGIPNPPPQVSVASNAGGPIIPTVPPKTGEDGLLGDGIAGMEGYAINQIPYHVNGPPIYGHPGGPFMLPNGYMTSSYYNPAMGVAAAAMGAGGPPAPPSTEIMMNPSCVPHFSFPFTIPHSFSNLPSTTSSKGISNAKDKANSLHGNSSNASGGATDSSSKSIPSNQHENHVTPASHSSGYYRTASQPNRNSRGVILDIGGGALGNSSLSPVSVDVAAMPPLDDLVETIHRPRKISCYNCGLDTHLGPDCKDGSMEEMTRHQFRVNYSGPSSVTADGKDGD